MSVRNNLAVVFLALPAMVAAIVIAEDQTPDAATTATLRTALAAAAPSRTSDAPRSTALVSAPQPDEAAATTYAAMRDDANPKPRLQLIDAWARDAPVGARLDLLSQAMVDPDEAVRARAQELFERRIQRH